MIDFADIIRDVHGKPIPEEISLGVACISALQQLFQGEDVAADVKVKRFKLAVKIAQATAPMALTADEVTTAKHCVGKYWNPLVVGRVFEALDPESVK